MAAKEVGKEKMAAKQEDREPAEVIDPDAARQKATRKLGAAKGLVTKAINTLRAAMDTNPRELQHRAYAESLLEQVDRRFDEVLDKFDLIEDLIETDAEGKVIEREREEMMMKIVEIKSSYTVWLEKASIHPASATVGAIAAGAAAGAAAGPGAAPGTDRSFYSNMAGIQFQGARMLGNQKFTGKDIRRYTEFRIQWEIVENQMTQLSFPDARKLIELKRALEGDALEKIERLPLEDANYEKAKAILDTAYKKPIRFAELVVLDLLHAPKMARDSKSMTATLNVIEQAQQALEGLRLSKAEAGELVFAVICESKLNNQTLVEWTKQKEKKKSDATPTGHTATLDDMKEIIRQQVTNAGIYERGNQEDPWKKEHKKEDKSKDKKNGTISGTFSTQKMADEAQCMICKKSGHKAADCFKLTKQLKTGQERVKFLEDQRINLCRNCLKGPHNTKDCRQANGCNTCRGKHHTILHYDRTRAVGTHLEQRRHTLPEPLPRQVQPPRQEPPPRHEPPRDLGASGPMVNAASAESGRLTPILQSCMAWVLGPGDNKQMARIFFDSGSELTLIKRDLAERLGLDGPCYSLHLRGVGGIQLPSTQEKSVQFRLASLQGDYTSHPIEGVTKARLTDKLREIQLDFSQFPHLQGLNLAEDIPRGRVAMDILIGIADYNQLVTGPIVAGEPGQPVAMKTKLGYVLSGAA